MIKVNHLTIYGCDGNYFSIKTVKLSVCQQKACLVDRHYGTVIA